MEQLLSNLGLLGIAFACAFPMAYERHRSGRPAGLRTFPIVSLASCAFILMGEQVLGGDPDAKARIIQGLMTGVGFIGGGAILDSRDRHGSLTGIATAASIWNTGAIGAAVGHQRFELAIALSLVNFAILRWLRPVVEDEAETDEVPEGEPP